MGYEIKKLPQMRAMYQRYNYKLSCAPARRMKRSKRSNSFTGLRRVTKDCINRFSRFILKMANSR